MGLQFLKIAVVYLIVGAMLGLFMGITQKFFLAPVHAHLLPLGWASFALAGLIYHLYPAAAKTRLAHIHFWLHHLALPVFMVALGMLLTGSESVVVVVGISASFVLIALAFFSANALINVKPSQ